MLAQFSKIIKTVQHQRDQSEDLKERNGRSREQVSSAYSGDYCCNLRAASVRHILLDGQISKGPIKRRDVRFCVNEACCARREARISVAVCERGDEEEEEEKEEEALQQLISRGHPVHDHSCTEKTACRRGSADAHIKVRRGGSCLCFMSLSCADRFLLGSP